jgi:hypothetical protein
VKVHLSITGAPNDFVHAKCVEEAIDLLATNTVCKFHTDYFLGDKKAAGSLALLWIRQQVIHNRFIPPTITLLGDEESVKRMEGYVKEIYMEANSVLAADLTIGKKYHVAYDATHHKGRVGILQFMAGVVRKTTAVLSNPGDNKVLFAVKMGDLIECQ